MKTGRSKIITGLFDKKRRIYFTDPKIWGYESVDQPVMEVYRIEIDGTV